MSKKLTYDELVQRIRELESGTTDPKNITISSDVNEQMYMHCFENANIGVCLVEPDGDFILVNNRMVEIFGYSKKEFEGMNVDDVSHPEDISVSKKIQRRVKSGEIEHTSFQKRYIHKNGSMFWGKVSNSIIKDQYGKPQYFVTHFLDITESENALEKSRERGKELELLVKERTEKLSQTNEALRDSEETLRTVIDISPFPIAFADANDEKIIYWSKSALEMFGHNPKTVSEWYELAYPDPVYRKQVIHRWKSFLGNASKSSKKINTGQYDIVCKDGTVKTCEIYAQFIRGYLIITLNDITERKKAEDILRTNEQRYKSAQRIGKVGNWEYDLVTETFWGSDQAKRIYGLDPASDRFTTEDVEKCIPERERVHQALIDLIEKGAPYNLEFDIQPISGSGTKTIRSIAEIVRDELRSPLKVFGVIQDITEQRKAEREKIKLAEQLKQSQKMEAIGLLAGGIAHDFNNILAAIIGFSQLALGEVKKNSPIEDDLQEILAAGKRAKELVTQVLAFARQSEEEIKPVRADIIIKEALQLIRATIPTSIKIKTDIHSKSLIMGNHTQLHQIVMNLCTNAAHAMEENGGILQVSLKDIVIERNFENEHVDLNYGDYINISFSDTGIGIPSDNLNSIFEPYFTTKKIGEGTGMGLAMVHGIVESYGGKILVKSTSGKGSTFDIYLPVTGKSDLHRQYESKPLPTGIERILVVDDEAPIAKMLAQNLERLGYTVTSKTSSLEALELFQTRPNDFDLIVTDMAMPNLTGDVLAIKLMKIRQDIPIILCTGYSKKITDETISQIGIKECINKPILQDDFIKTVRKVLDEAKG